MEDTIFGLPAQSHAKLSREDLQSMGKQAAIDYLSNGTSLNDAVIKVARMHPSISTHQVKRVVEYANQETFSRLFSDGEKYANDKNIEFPVADPGVVLQTLEISAQPQSIDGTPSEYGCEPMKTAHADVEADLALAREFGVDLASPNSERTSVVVMEKEAQANDLVITNIMTVGMTKEADGDAADRILAAGEEGIMPESAAALSTEQVPDVARQETEEEEAQKVASVATLASLRLRKMKKLSDKEIREQAAKGKKEKGDPEWFLTAEESKRLSKTAMGPMALDVGGAAAPGDVGEEQSQHPEITHRENMRSMERRIELEKKKQELVTMQQKGMQAAGDMGGAPPPPGDEAGPPPAGGGEGAAPPPPEGMGMDPMAAPPPGAAPAGPAGGMPPMEMPPPTGPMPTGPAPGLPGGAPFPMKKAHVEAALELTKQAMTMAKTSSKHAAGILDDLRDGASLDRIKQATAAKESQYPEANPFGDLIRMKQKLAKIVEDSTAARDKNHFMMKEARDDFLHHVTQHMFAGGNLGEVTHAVSQVTPDEETVKVAMDHVVNHLIDKGLDINQAQAQLIQYEMEKGASVRPINPDNPIIESFSAFCKIAQMQDELEQAVKDVNGYYDQVEGVLSEAMKSAPSA